MGLYGQVWASMGSYGQIWVFISKFGFLLKVWIVVMDKYGYLSASLGFY